MTYRNTPLSSHLQSPMQILTSRTTRSTLPLSNAAKMQMGLHGEELRVTQKNQHLPTHNLCLDQTVMYQNPSNKKWYPAKITKLCDEPRSYIISTADGTQYRKLQKHLKPYRPRPQINVKGLLTQCNNNQMQLRSRNNLKKNSYKISCNLIIGLNKRNQANTD